MVNAASTFPSVSNLPEVNTTEMIEVDRLMMEDYRIGLVQMMENAGRCFAIVTRACHLGRSANGARVAVLAGGGGNGGGALAAARRLATWGAKVSVVLAQAKEEMAEVPRLQLDILLGLSNATLAVDDTPVGPFDAILDGLIGYSLKGAPQGRTAELIHWANQEKAPIVSLDVPSGFDAENGVVMEPAMRATSTVTLALPKRGMHSAGYAAYVGAVYCADISVPSELYRRLNPKVELPAIFGDCDILRVAG